MYFVFFFNRIFFLSLLQSSLQCGVSKIWLTLSWTNNSAITIQVCVYNESQYMRQTYINVTIALFKLSVAIHLLEVPSWIVLSLYYCAKVRYILFLHSMWIIIPAYILYLILFALFAFDNAKYVLGAHYSPHHNPIPIQQIRSKCSNCYHLCTEKL